MAETGHPVGYNGAAAQPVTITKGATANVGFRNDRQIDLAVVKSNAGVFVTGSGAVYTIDVTNNGPASETHAVVTDVLPTGLTFVSATGAGWHICRPNSNSAAGPDIAAKRWRADAS